MNDILQEIVDKRKIDIEKRGFGFGFDVPERRGRKVHPFLAERGAIFEVKRASPSRGDIAPNLDAAATARKYAESGARAISCLTEENFFRGNLGDLMDVCRAMDDFERETGKDVPAVLRKDFLFSEEDVEAAFLAGADAVLLIARILEEEMLVKMAKRCESLGISALVEIREDSDLEKLEGVLKSVGAKTVVCGVNSRDLRDFSIDMLVPAAMLTEIRKIEKNARVVFESGILTPETAAFVSSMGFHAFLMGEAAARNPERAAEFARAFEESGESANGRTWTRFACRARGRGTRPLVKICGLARKEDALLAAELGADFLGFVFCEKSRRNVDSMRVREIRKSVLEKFGENRPEFVGVITELGSAESDAALSLVREGVLDKIQFHGFDPPPLSDRTFAWLPRYAAANVSDESDVEKVAGLFRGGEPRVLIDSRSGGLVGGTGTSVDAALVRKCAALSHLWLAGGITAENVGHIIEEFSPELVDVASGVEIALGIKDAEKLKRFFGAAGC